MRPKNSYLKHGLAFEELFDKEDLAINKEATMSTSRVAAIEDSKKHFLYPNQKSHK